MSQLDLFCSPAPEPATSRRPLARARRARDRGMAVATAHAESHQDGWRADLALAFLRRYSQTHERFQAWEVTAAARDSGELPVVSGKAWGQVFTAAARQGWIVKDGFGPDPNRHLNPAPFWRATEVRPCAS